MNEVMHMPIITKITFQQKNKDRYNIFIDDGHGEKYGFSVDEDVLIKFNIKKGLELDEYTLTEIQFADDIRKALNLAIHHLARRMRSEGEIRTFLLKKEVDELIINEVIYQLTEMRYINDEEFANAYIRTQMNTTDKGPDVIKRELIEKGVHRKNYEQPLSMFTVEQQVEKALLLAKKYVEKNQRDSHQVLIQKTKQMLMRKGYHQDAIQIVMDEASFEKETDQEMTALRIHGEKAHKRFAHLQRIEYTQKMKQTLYRKGFSLDLIEQFLLEKSEE